MQDDEEGHLIFKPGDVIQSRYADHKLSVSVNFNLADTRLQLSSEKELLVK